MRSFRKPHLIKRKKSIFKSRFFRLSILAPMALGVFIYFFLFSEFFQVKKIIITGEEKVSKDEIQSIAEKKIENKILFFASKNIFLVNSDEIKKDILNEFPRIDEVKIGQAWLSGALNVLVAERKEIAIWCQGENCFFLDKEGVIFEPVAETEFQTFKIKDLTSSGELKLGSKVIEKEKLDQILQIDLKTREDLKIPLKEISMESPERFNAKTSEGWEIYFNPKKDLNWQMAELATVLEKKVPPEKRGNIIYIDLRFDRVYIFPETYGQ